MKSFLLCLLVLGCNGQSNPDPNKWLNNILNPQKKNPSNICDTDNHEEGRCVKFTECMNGNEIDLDKMDVYRASSCHYLKTCCPINQLIQSGKVTEPPVPNKPDGCGWSNPGGYIFRDSSKSHAEFGEFPWMVALIRKVNQNQAWDPKDYLGGGTLIHPSVVMTVAHKIKAINNDPTLLKCRLGEWDTQSTNEIYPHQDRDVRQVLVHEEFSSRTSANNVALVLTFSPFDLSNPHVGVACLNFDEPKADATCFSMGWGKDFNDDNKYAVWLKKVPLPIVDRDTCEYALQASRLGSNFRLHNTLLCAGGVKSIDTCNGDGGSPLACRISSEGGKTRYQVYGMVAFGVECGTGLPAAYVNLQTVYQWILKKFNEEKLDVSFNA